MPMNSASKIAPAHPAGDTGDTIVLTEALFRKWLDLEQRRLERSYRKLILLLIELPVLSGQISQKIVGTLCHAGRETDIKGWYRDNSTFGIIFTEIAPQADRALGVLLTKKI